MANVEPLIAGMPHHVTSTSDPKVHMESLDRDGFQHET